MPTSLAAPAVVLSSDPDFVEEARRWCIAVGHTPTVISQHTQIRRAWREAAFIVLDAGFADDLEAVDLPQRDRVFVVAKDPRELWAAPARWGAQALLPRHDDHGIVAALAEAVDPGGEACVVSVVGACGGVGTSTLTTALACRAAERGLKSALIDGDPVAGGLDLVLGAEHVEGMRWPDLADARGHVGVAELSSVLPSKHGVDIVSFGRTGADVLMANSVLNAVVRGFDAVFADVPRYGGLSTELLTRSVATLVIVPRRIQGVVAAERLLPILEELCGNVLVVSRGSDHGLDRHRLAERLRRPVLTEIARSRRLATDIEHGLGPRNGPITRTADTILDAVGLA